MGKVKRERTVELVSGGQKGRESIEDEGEDDSPLQQQQQQIPQLRDSSVLGSPL